MSGKPKLKKLILIPTALVLSCAINKIESLSTPKATCVINNSIHIGGGKLVWSFDCYEWKDSQTYCELEGGTYYTYFANCEEYCASYINGICHIKKEPDFLMYRIPK